MPFYDGQHFDTQEELDKYKRDLAQADRQGNTKGIVDYETEVTQPKEKEDFKKGFFGGIKNWMRK